MLYIFLRGLGLGCFTFGTNTFGPLYLWARDIWAKFSMKMTFGVKKFSLYFCKIQLPPVFELTKKPGLIGVNTKNLESLSKRAASYQISNYENDLPLGVLESGPTASSEAGAGRQTFS